MGKEKILRATHGSDKTQLELGEVKIPCYVLSNGTRVFSGRGIQKALGSTATSGTWLTKFVNESPIATHFKTGVLDQLNAPIKFIRPSAGGSQSTTYGYEVTILIDICDSILEANKTGSKIEKTIVLNAEAIIRSVAKVGIIALVDEVTGYQYAREKDELQKILKAYIAEELLPWQKRFPNIFYKEIFRLNGWDYTVENIKKKPSVVGIWTNKLIYEQLPKGVLEELKKATPKSESGNYTAKFHQSLTPDVGHPNLQSQLASVIALMQISENWKELIHHFNKMVERKKGQLTLSFDDFEEKSTPMPIPLKTISPFNQNLKGLLNTPPPEKKKKKKNEEH